MQIKDDKGRVIGLEDADYEEATAFKCPKCGKLLDWQHDEDDVNVASCCGKEYRMYGTKFTVEALE